MDIHLEGVDIEGKGVYLHLEGLYSNIYMYISIYIYIHTYIHTSTYIHTYIYIYIYGEYAIFPPPPPWANRCTMGQG